MNKMNKKGVLFELITILVIFVMFVIGVMIAYKFVTDFNANNSFESGSLSQNITGLGINAIKGFDSLAVFLLIGLTIYVIVSAFFIQTHPVFFIIGILGLLVLLTLTGLMSNLINGISGQSEFSGYSSNFVIIPYIINHLPLFFAIIGVLVLIGVYAKDKFTNG